MKEMEQSVNQTSEEAKLLEEIKQEAEKMKKQSQSGDNEVSTEKEADENTETKAELSQENNEETPQDQGDTKKVIQKEQKEASEQKPAKTLNKIKIEDYSSVVFEKPVIIKNRGLNLPVYNMAELIKMAEMGVDYTRKTQEIAPYRKMVETIKATNIDESDLQLLAEIKAGNKTAINGLAEKYKIDLLDVEPTAQYKQQVKLPEYTEADLVAQEIIANEPLAKEFKKVIQFVPNDFKEALAKDANLLRSFAIDVESGLAQRILPDIIKIMTINPNIDFLTAYIQAGDMYFSRLAQEQQHISQQATNVNANQQNINANTINATISAKEKAGVVSKASSFANTNDSDDDIWKDGLSEEAIIARIKEQANKMKAKYNNKNF